MADPRDTDRLDAALRDLAAHLDLPPVPDVAGRVRARLELEEGAERGRVRRRPRVPRSRRATVLVAVIGAVVVVLSLVAAIPSARHAAARLLVFRGERITREQPKRPPVRRALDEYLD